MKRLGNIFRLRVKYIGGLIETFGHTRALASPPIVVLLNTRITGLEVGGSPLNFVETSALPEIKPLPKYSFRIRLFGWGRGLSAFQISFYRCLERSVSRLLINIFDPTSGKGNLTVERLKRLQYRLNYFLNNFKSSKQGKFIKGKNILDVRGW